MAKINTIAVSIAGAEASMVTARYAICLAKLLNAQLVVIYVVDTKALGDLLKSKVFVRLEAIDYERDLEEHGHRYLRRIEKMAEEKGVKAVSILSKGVVHDEVVNISKEKNADLLVIGELKEISSRRDIFYDEGERIFREAYCPVVVVKNKEMVNQLYKEL